MHRRNEVEPMMTTKGPSGARLCDQRKTGRETTCAVSTNAQRHLADRE